MIAGYKKLINKKQFKDVSSGFDIKESELNTILFGFQKAIVRWALIRGRAAIFADTGLGKSFMQIEWAKQVFKKTSDNILILSPLCVASQTVSEAKKLGVRISYIRNKKQITEKGIYITNYEMIDNFDLSVFVGIVLDESSILKHQSSKIRKKIIDATSRVRYRLSCTATPSPNDHMELANQAEFLGLMRASEMLSMFFTHDGSDTSKWRLKGHGRIRFWEWMATWSVCIKKPSDLGFDDAGYNLPPINTVNHHINVGIPKSGEFFATPVSSFSEKQKNKRESIDERVAVASEIVNNSNDIWVIWCNRNDESSVLSKEIKDSVELKGSDSIDKKENIINEFTRGNIKVLITKQSIAGFGVNWQHCHNTLFIGLSDSYEQYYQAVRRFYRFGQTKTVNVHRIITDMECAIKVNIDRKAKQHDHMSHMMINSMRDFMKKKIINAKVEESEYKTKKDSGEGWDLYLGDCVDVSSKLKSDSIDYSIFSPPFASLYTYSNSPYDMGNSRTHSDFYKQFEYLVKELFRITKSGRLLSFHCMNLPISKQMSGYIGISDFRGELIKLFVNNGWIYHSEVVIWKDPVVAMQRTKALGLLHKQIKKDSSMSRQGLPDYLVTMRKPGDNLEPIKHTDDSFPVSVWQKYASPIWMDIRQSDTLQFRKARDNDDERHICPLQLEVISRAIDLWTNPNDLVFSPFAGIGSEGYIALKKNRCFVGSELKESYFKTASKNLRGVIKETGNLFFNNFDFK